MANDMYRLATDLLAIAERHVQCEGEGGPHVYRYLEWNSGGAPAYGFGSESPYALADLATLRFAVFDPSSSDAKIATSALLDRLQRTQGPDSGLFEESSHHPFHTTACAVSALARWGKKPRLRVRAMDRYLLPGAITEVLEAVRWDVNPWRDSNIPAGIVTTLMLTLDEDETRAVREEFFLWLDKNLDQTGLWSAGKIFDEGARGRFTHLAAAFHFLFLYEFFEKKHPKANELFQECLKFLDGRSEMPFNREPGYLEIDLLYCLIRSGRQCLSLPELERLVSPFVESFVSGMKAWSRSVKSSDVHKLLGAALVACEVSLLWRDCGFESSDELAHPLDKAPYA